MKNKKKKRKLSNKTDGISENVVSKKKILFQIITATFLFTTTSSTTLNYELQLLKQKRI